MNPRLKGLLLNAFVFPGSGHLATGNKTRGWLYLLLGLAGLVTVIYHVVAISGDLMTYVQETGTTDQGALQDMAMAKLQSGDGTILSWVIPGMILLWLVALIDIAITAKRNQKSDPATD